MEERDSLSCTSDLGSANMMLPNIISVSNVKVEDEFYTCEGVIDRMKDSSIQQIESGTPHTICENADDSIILTVDGCTSNADSGRSEVKIEHENTKVIGVNEEPNSFVIEIEQNEISSAVDIIDCFENSISQSGEGETKVIRKKRGRPKKHSSDTGKSAGSNNFTAKDSIEADDWETVEPVIDEVSGVRRSGRKRRQKRISYIDLLEGNEDLSSWRKKKCDDDNDWYNDDAKKESLKEDGESSPMPPSSPHSPIKKNTVNMKRKVAVRRRETLQQEGQKDVEEKQDNNVVEMKDLDHSRCENCHVSFLSHEVFKIHSLKCSAENPAVPKIHSNIRNGYDKEKTCPICGKYYSKRFGVKRHLTLQHTNLVHISCALCSKKIGDVEDNYKHFQKEHQSLIPEGKECSAPGLLQCPVCCTTFASNSLMKTHLVNFHSNLIRVRCALCQRTVGSMLKYYSHFLRYHSHSSGTGDKNKREVITTNIDHAKAKQKASNVVGSCSDNSGLVCNQCNKQLENYKLLALHILSHKVDENIDIAGSYAQQSLVVDSNSNADLNTSEPSSSSNSILEPFPVMCLPPEPLNEVSSTSAVLGPDLTIAVNRSLNVMAGMASRLRAELQWKEKDSLCPKDDLVRRLNRLLQFSSGITDIGRGLLLVMDETREFKGNPYAGNRDIDEEFDEQDEDIDGDFVDDNDDISETGNRDEGEKDNGIRYNDEIEIDIASDVESNAVHERLIVSNHKELDLSLSDSIPVGETHTEMAPSTVGLDGGKDGNCSNDEPIEKKSGCDRKSDTANITKLSSQSEAASGTDRRTSRRLKDKESTSLDKSNKKSKKKYVCRRCGKVLSRKSRLVNHMACHSEAKPFKCNICPSTFKREAALRRHLLVHLKDGQFKCDFCDFSHRLQSVVQKHSLEEHPHAPLFSCDLCRHQAKTSHDLSIHKNVHEPKKCRFCDFAAQDHAELQRHNRKNHATRQCSHCSACFYSKYELKKHMRTHVKPEFENVFCCELCGATFDTMRRLNYHVLRHTNKTPYECSQCDYKCSSRQSYDAHMLKHSGLRPYKCKLCDADFHRSSYLKQHMRMHSDEKGFCCRYCGKGFKYRYNVREHEMIHTGEKKFKCKLCNFACRRRKILEQHLAQHKARGSDVEDLSGAEVGEEGHVADAPVSVVSDISGLLLKSENLVPIV